MKIALVVLSITSLSFMISYIAVNRKLKAVTTGFSDLFTAYGKIRETLEAKQTFDSSASDQDIHKENFIKFLSDSRDWAFNYIEEVQTGINNFLKEVEPKINYFDTYGIVIEGMPHHDDMKIISEQVKELKKLLPEDIDDRR